MLPPPLRIGGDRPGHQNTRLIPSVGICRPANATALIPVGAAHPVPL